MQPSAFPGHSFSKARPASCCPSSHHSSHSFLMDSEFTTRRALSLKHKQEARTVPVIDGLVMSSNQFVRAACVDPLVKLPLGGARTMSFRGHTVQTVAHGRWLDTWSASGRSSEH